MAVHEFFYIKFYLNQGQQNAIIHLPIATKLN